MALAECLKATLVVCVLQVRVSLFFWQVAHIHRRRSATCRATVLARCVMRLFRVDVYELRGVSQREVRPDGTRAQVLTEEPSNFLSIAAGVHAKLSLACPDARDQRFQDGALRAALSHWDTVPTVLSEDRCPLPPIHFRQDRVRAAPVGIEGTLEVHTGAVLSGTDIEQKILAHPSHCGRVLRCLCWRHVSGAGSG